MQLIRIYAQDGMQKQQARITFSPSGNHRTLLVSLCYRKYSKKWYMSVYDLVDQKYLITNIPVLCSKNMINNLLAQFDYMNIGKAFVQANSDADMGIDPSIDNIESYKIIWSD